MNLQITDFGTSLLNQNTGPIELDTFKLGSAFNYLPAPTDTDIHGTLLFTGTPSIPFVANANLIKYSAYLDPNVETIQFGEIGFYVADQLFALGSSSELIDKIQAGETDGNSIRIDAYLSVVGTNFTMWFDLAESNNEFQVASLASPDMLPPSNNATPNMYVVQGADSTQAPFLSYTDRLGLWNFDAYEFIDFTQATITGFDNESVTIASTEFSNSMVPTFFGQVILEFTTGKIFSICRYVLSAVQTGSTATIGFQTQLAVLPSIGDKVRLFVRNNASVVPTIPTIPIATATQLGGIKIGSGFLELPDGTLSVDPAELGAVTSVNGQTGTVIINASNLPGLAPVAVSGSFNDLTDKPLPFVLPPMSLTVRGGARLPPSGNLVITNTDVLDLSFLPVKRVNGVGPDTNGNVALSSTVIGLVNPIVVGSGSDLNLLTTTGLFTVSAGTTLINAPATGAATLEVVPLNSSGTGDSVQRWTSGTAQFWRKSTAGVWTQWFQVATNTIATTNTLGIVKIGTGLSVAVDGTVSLPVATATTTQLGVIKVGTGLAIAGDGTLSATSTFVLPIASSTVLGGIKIGSGLTVAGDGTVSATPVSDNTKLNVINGIAQGLFIKGNTLGVTTTTLTASVATANFQTATFTGGNVAWALNGWPAAPNYAELEFQLTNAGLATHTFQSGTTWVNPDGTTTTNFATYMTNKRGTTNFQTAGIDFVIFWSFDNGTTIFARVL